MDGQVRVETVAARPLAVVRRRAAIRVLARVIPEACGVVWNAVRARGVTGAGRHVAVYLDEQGNVEVGVEVEGPVAWAAGEVVNSATPGGRVATAAHLGPYGGLAEAHRAIRAWCAAGGESLAGVCWEVYGHWDEAWTSDPSQIRTDVYYLLGGD